MEKKSRNKPLMIVDDDRDVRESILEVLADNEYQAFGARNGKEALERLRSMTPKPALILLDVMMPVMDGWSFRAEQKKDPVLGSIPVVVLTAHASADETARQMGAEGFLKKPVKLEALLSVVRRYCEHPSG